MIITHYSFNLLKFLTKDFKKRIPTKLFQGNFVLKFLTLIYENKIVFLILVTNSSGNTA